MATKRLIRYKPDYATRPGEVLEAYLAERGMTKADLAARCGRPTKTISEIIHGKTAITPETALQLERVLGRPASLWQNLEARYRLHLAETGESSELAAHASWAKRFPIKDMIAQGHIEQPKDDTDLVKQVLRFFGVGTFAGWVANFGGAQVAYRRSPAFEAAPESVTAWIRLGETEADRTECEPFNKARFKAVLAEVRSLTTEPFREVQETLVERCASAGVVVALVRPLPKIRLSGIARWVSKDKALIQLSLRHKTGDHVWFSFFHEAGHILLHGKKAIFVDGNGEDVTELEHEANRFAADSLVPSPAFNAFCGRADFSASAIKKFASKQGVAPGIVVGRLQHTGAIPYSLHNELKERLDWAD